MAKLIFTPEELIEACDALIKKGRFRPGYDNMTPAAAMTVLKIDGEKLCRRLNAGKYEAKPAVGFFSAKTDGGYRKLARLTATDTVIQYAAIEKLTPECEAKFSDRSFAYRRGRGVGDALQAYCALASQCRFAAKIDPKACFDNIDHTVLRDALNAFFGKGKTTELLMRFAAMPVLAEGELTERNRGILQGAPISGMLCNLYFHALDAALTENGIPFLRYADDTVVFANGRSEIEQAAAFVCDFLTERLRLQINETKRRIAPAEDMTYLGHTFLRDKTGAVSVYAGNGGASAYYSWNREKPLDHRNSVDILSDGILRQKDFSAEFAGETGTVSIPTAVTERINIFSNVIFDSGFLKAAMEAGVYVNVFSDDYSFIGRFVPFAPLKNQRLIFEQLQAYNNDALRLQLAKEFDMASVHNLRLVIRYYNKQAPNDVFGQALKKIDALYAAMKTCKDHARLLLLEANVRELYYGCYAYFLKNEAFHFGGRTRKPPMGAVNSLLSFGNVVLYNYIAAEIYKSSLDIRIGFLHATNKRMESLNLDIAEIFKPLVVDRTVFTLINRKELSPEHFVTAANGGIYLNENGKRIFLRAFYDKLNTTLTVGERSFSYAALINEEIRKLTRRFRSGEPYKAFRQVR